MPVETISSARLANLLREGVPLVVLDVRLKEDYDLAHLEGARSNCVFEVAFGERLAETAPDHAVPVCVYGADASSREAEMAAEKLRRAGYGTIYQLTDGLAGCCSAQLPLKKSGEPSQAAGPALNGSRVVDLKESRIEWIGRNLLNKHSGSIGLKSGVLNFQNGRLSGGEFIVDMQAMACADLHGHELHDVLIAHLQSDDFFDVELFPEARFVITGAEPILTAAPGAANLRVHGQLTLKGVTRPLELAAVAGLTPDGKGAAQAVVAIDRTLWHVIYGSGKFFRRLGGHLVNDLIEVQLRVVTE